MKILIIGAGSFGTAMANQLVKNKINEVFLLCKNEKQAEEINVDKTNKKYYSNYKLSDRINAVTTINETLSFELVFLSIPSSEIENIIGFLKKIKKNTTIVNLSKGITKSGETIVEYLRSVLNNDNIVSMKGATFASEMINNSASLFTLGFDKNNQYEKVSSAIKETDIYLDYTSDIRGVELLSVLKNIYAILIGIVDAKYNSANTRFMILTKSFSEIKKILRGFGGKEDTIFLSAGLGDISLTSLNDLSRNRTLGLLIGKGFYSTAKTINNSVVLEGVKAINLIHELKPNYLKGQTVLLDQLYNFFNSEADTLDINFDFLVKKSKKIVITYGTFDLLHYGHLEVLRRSKELGDKLIVGLSTDEFNLSKGKECVITYEKRKEMLESLDYVDLVIPENNWEQKVEDVKNYSVDLFVMGNDWTGEFDFLKEECEVLYLERTKGISTTKLKSILEN